LIASLNKTILVSITIKDIPDHLHRALKQRARLHHRSLNKEVLATIEVAIQGSEGHQEVKLGTGNPLTFFSDLIVQ
jgi:plasmid stability protein